MGVLAVGSVLSGMQQEWYGVYSIRSSSVSDAVWVDPLLVVLESAGHEAGCCPAGLSLCCCKASQASCCVCIAHGLVVVMRISQAGWPGGSTDHVADLSRFRHAAEHVSAPPKQVVFSMLPTHSCAAGSCSQLHVGLYESTDMHLVPVQYAVLGQLKAWLNVADHVLCLCLL